MLEWQRLLRFLLRYATEFRKLQWRAAPYKKLRSIALENGLFLIGGHCRLCPALAPIPSFTNNSDWRDSSNENKFSGSKQSRICLKGSLHF